MAPMFTVNEATGSHDGGSPMFYSEEAPASYDRRLTVKKYRRIKVERGCRLTVARPGSLKR